MYTDVYKNIIFKLIYGLINVYIYKRNDGEDKNIIKFSVSLYYEKKMGRGLVAPEGITVSIMKKKNSEKKYYYKIKFRMKFNSNINCHISL